MMATKRDYYEILGVNRGASLDEIKKVYQVKDKIVKTMNMTQSTIIDSNGNWSTVVSAAVFLF